jgi:hypothetical protein
MRLAPRLQDLEDGRRPFVDAGVARQPQKTPFRGWGYGFAVAAAGRARAVPLLVWLVQDPADGCRLVEEGHARCPQWTPALELTREVVAPARHGVL